MSSRSAGELAGSAEGRALLEEHGVHTDAKRFRAALRPAARPELARSLGLAADATFVYVGQQVAADYTTATTAKFAAVHELTGVDCALLWHDMDRAGSERYALRVVLQLGGRGDGVWLASRRLENREPRFIAAELDRLDELLRKGRNAADGLPRDRRARARERLERLVEEVREEAPPTMAQLAETLTRRMLREHLSLGLPCRFVSDVAAAGLVRETMLDVLGALDDVVAVFNESVARLERAGIDPQVRRLPDAYLPLWYSCPVTGDRLRLARAQSGRDRFGVADCRCGAEHRFHLGDGTPSLAELEATGRWSPDVLLPALHDELASGYVAGRSTALYGIVLRDVLRALGREPTPSFLPSRLTDRGEAVARSQTLLNAYLAA